MRFGDGLCGSVGHELVTVVASKTMTVPVYLLLKECALGKGPDDYLFTREIKRKDGTVVRKPIGDSRKTWWKVCVKAGVGRMSRTRLRSWRKQSRNRKRNRNRPKRPNSVTIQSRRRFRATRGRLTQSPSNAAKRHTLRNLLRGAVGGPGRI